MGIWLVRLLRRHPDRSVRRETAAVAGMRFGEPRWICEASGNNWRKPEDRSSERAHSLRIRRERNARQLLLHGPAGGLHDWRNAVRLRERDANPNQLHIRLHDRYSSDLRACRVLRSGPAELVGELGY